MNVQPPQHLATALGHCPACGDDARAEHGVVNGLRLVRCVTCDLVYSDPQPVERVRAQYLREYDLAAHFAEVEARKRVLFARRLDWLGAPPRAHARLCDVGCGDGLFLEMAAEVGWEPVGIELNPPAAEAARRRGICIVEGAVEEADDLPWASFDVVCSWDAIEHTPTPRAFAERLAALARPGAARVFVTTLNADSLVARAMGLRWGMIEEGHFTYWNERSLRALHRAVGLDVTDVGFFGLGRDLVAILDRLGRRRGRTTRGAMSAPGAGLSWDSKRLTLVAERVVNRALDRTKLGVGILVESLRSD